MVTITDSDEPWLSDAKTKLHSYTSFLIQQQILLKLHFNAVTKPRRQEKFTEIGPLITVVYAYILHITIHINTHSFFEYVYSFILIHKQI